MLTSQKNTAKEISTKHVPHPDGQQGLLIERMGELVNECMMMFHHALELHWNYQGPNFLGVHTFLDAHYRKLLENFDGIAERAVTMGGQIKLRSSAHTMQQKSHGSSKSPDISIDHYLTSAETFAEKLRDLIKASECDDVTNDMLIKFSGEFEKDMWQLRSTLGIAPDRRFRQSEMI